MKLSGPSAHRSIAAGFSLLEVMVALAILSIILFIGIPSFQSLFESARERAATSSLVTAISLARSEALVRNTVSRVCVTDACAVGSNEIRVEAETDEGEMELLRVWETEQNIAYRSGGVDGVTFRFSALGLAVNASGEQLEAPRSVDVVDLSESKAKVLNSYCVSVTGSLTKGECQ